MRLVGWSNGGACAAGLAATLVLTGCNLGEPAVHYQTPLSGFASADVDGDGDIELVTTGSSWGTDTEDGFSPAIVVLDNDGAGGFSPTPVQGDPSPLPYWDYTDVALGDVDGDGDSDLVSFRYNDRAGVGEGVDVRLNDGTGVFGPRTNIHYSEDHHRDLVVADLDGDGDLDVLGAGDQLTMIRGDGSGGFEAPESVALPLGGPYGSVAVDDLDGDGWPDIVATDYDSGSTSVAVALGDGTGEFSSATVLEADPASFGGFATAVSDLNGDGLPDIVVGNSDNTSGYDATVSILLNQGGATFAEPTILALGGVAVEDLAVADIDADGWTDVVAASRGHGGTTVLYGDGTGDLPERHGLYTGGDENHVEAVDLDGDGLADVATSHDGVDVMLNRFEGRREH